MKKLICALLLSSTCWSYLTPQPFYAGLNSNEATLSFDYFVDTDAATEPTKLEAMEIVEHQLTYIYGGLAYLKTPASPYGHQKIKLLKTEKTNNGFRIHYSYIVGITISSQAGPELVFPLPRDPKKIFSQSHVVNQGKVENPCGDEEHPEESHYWYFWAPHIPGCPLVDGVHYDWVKAKLRPIANTKNSLPEYERLLDQNKVIRMDIFVGMDNSQNSGNVFDSKDYNAFGYNEVRDYLLKQGFSSSVWTREQVTERSAKVMYQQVTVEDLKKETPRGTLHVRLFFGPTSTWNSFVFRHFYKESLEQASVVVYIGHSGFGQNLKLDGLENNLGEKINFNQDKYQIFYFNACSTYPYFNSSYFDRKGGSRNLDIITNGLSTFLREMAPSTIRLVDMIHTWALTGEKLTYQDFLMKADSFNLLGVNGDEDNPTADEPSR